MMPDKHSEYCQISQFLCNEPEMNKYQLICVPSKKVNEVENDLVKCLFQDAPQVIFAESRDVFFIYDENDYWAFGYLAGKLPAGDYEINDWNLGKSDKLDFNRGYLGYLLGCYEFNKYKKPAEKAKPIARLIKKDLKTSYEILKIAEAVCLTRDLINEPPNHLYPETLAEFAKKLADKHGASHKIVDGNELEQEFPLIHNVGKGSSHRPCMIELNWGNENHPKIALVGKGVCFDSGGLDLKSSSNMLLMKKDMGGAAHVLGLADVIMAMNLPINLKIIIGAVENMPDGNAYRASDIIQARNKKFVEIGNTDAEGRLVLADCLAYACQWQPELIIDYATLTGAARVAVGIGMAAMFSDNDEICASMTKIGDEHNDFVWRLPLHKPYKKILKSQFADIGSTGNSPYGGSIVAALFLQEFVDNKIPWVHFDIMAWNTSSSPAKPEGGEAIALRTAYYYLKEKYAPK